MPQHFMSFMRARPGKDPADFKEWYLNAYAPRLQAGNPRPSHHVVNLTVPGPDELKLSHDSSDPLARYDVVAQMHFSTTAE
ncbi:MAG: hypothetical protein J4F33_07765, partial [Alphaproteobacteria bacterium]|nr:hypothetical protein [Alphaproteobacteria bacterium]